ncbi:EGF-like domain protein, partial [Ostertagia ostertagi]
MVNSRCVIAEHRSHRRYLSISNLYRLFDFPANCHLDEDCLNGGKCMKEPNSITSASCYCTYGFFGKNCEQSVRSKRSADVEMPPLTVPTSSHHLP